MVMTSDYTKIETELSYNRPQLAATLVSCNVGVHYICLALKVSQAKSIAGLVLLWPVDHEALIV